MQMDDVVAIYHEYAAFPQLIAAKISASSTSTTLTVNSKWQQNDVERMEKTKFTRDYVVNVTDSPGLYEVVSRTAPCDTTNELWNVESPSGQQRAIIRKQKDKKGEEQQYIEIWTKERKRFSLTADKLKAHDKIYNNDGHLGCLCWSQSEVHLLYVAEKKSPKTASFLEKKASAIDQETDVGTSDKEETVKGDAHVYKDSWGELLEKTSRAVLCVLNIDTQVVSLVDNVPDGITPGQAIWGPDDAGVVFVGWNELPWRLGLVYCSQRQNALYYHDLQLSECKNISDGDRSVCSPVFNRERTRLFYLDSPVGGPHRHCSRLLVFDWSTQETTILVDVVADSSIANEEFPGLYAIALNPSCVSADGTQLYLSTQWRMRQDVVAVNIESKEIVRISHNSHTADAIGSWALLDVYQDHILVACSSPNRPPFLMIGRLVSWSCLISKGEEGSNKLLSWRQLDAPVSNWGPGRWTVMRHLSPGCVNTEYPHVGYESVLYLPHTYDSLHPPPLIVMPHGGPHSAYILNFSLGHSAYTMVGYAVLEVSYRGSTGYGEHGIKSLPGRIGDQDVKDVQEAVEKHLHLVDPNNVFIMGGSHGGFLATHLIGQYPNFYKAASCRNPVTDLTCMFSASDIPDWVCTEGGFEFDHKFLPTAQQLATLLNISPIFYVDHVRTPVLMCLGEKDLRVPPRQGLSYARALQARDVPVRVLTYPEDSHGLVSVDAESDVFGNTVAWFQRFRQK